MNATQLGTLLSHTIPAGHNVLLVGPPGVGKTKIVGDVCDKLNVDLLTTHPAVGDPTDVKGLPWMVDGHATFLPFGDLEQALNATRPLVWFFDDLGQAPAAMQAGCMQLFHGGRVNGHKLPDCITFIAATNRRMDKAGVSGILEPVKSRFVTIVNLEADVNESIKYALTHGWDPSIPAFWRLRNELLCKFEATADMTNSPVPRTWEHVSQLLALHLPSDIRGQALAGAIGEGPAVEFSAFLTLMENLPNVDAIIENPKKLKIPSDPSTLYALASALAYRTTKDTIDNIITFAQRMVDASHAEFAVLLLRDAIQRDQSLVTTPAFMSMSVSELGKMISGGK